MVNILGIDPGLTGGMAIVDEHGAFISATVMPRGEKFIDLPALHSYFAALVTEQYKVYLENVHSMPSQGVASSFKFGRVFGAIEGMLCSLGFNYTLITPQKWQKTVHLPEDRERIPNPKDRALASYTRLFPNVDLRASDRCKIPHKGLVDALLIAEAGRRMEKEL